jgi:3-deoxy-manno-octulosonate cytidylyltransferase (CMP-KDO synthetase)
MPGSLIDDVARTLANHPQTVMSTACHPLAATNEQNDPNVVKVVTDADGLALYFSRAPIPWSRENQTVHAQRHIGIYGYRVGLLKTFARWQRSDLERIEQLEQLRVLYYGERIIVHHTAAAPGIGVDTREDLVKFEQSLASI